MRWLKIQKPEYLPEELQEVTFNHPSDIGYEDMNFYKKMYCKTIFVSDNCLGFRKNISEKLTFRS